MDQRSQSLWYAVYVRSRYEKKVHRELQEREVESFLPLLETVRQWSDRKKLVVEPLFRGYVFVSIDYHREHLKVLEVDGVVRFISVRSKPAIVSERDIRWLKILAREVDAIQGPVTSLPPGQMVRVVAGPFKDFEGVVVKSGRKDRMVVFFDSIMQGVEIQIHPEWLTRLPSSDKKTARQI